MASSDKTFPEFKFLSFYAPSEDVGTFQFYPAFGQASIDDRGPQTCKVVAELNASFNEETKTILMLLSYRLAGVQDTVSAGREFKKRTGVTKNPGEIVQALTDTAASNSRCYDIAREAFDEWVTNVTVLAATARAGFEPRPGDEVVVVDGPEVDGDTALIEPAPYNKSDRKNGKAKK